MHDLDTLLAFAESLADAARPLALKYFRQPLLGVDYKADDSPVTRADRETEAVLRRLIQARYPQHGIFGEEHGREGLEREWVWVIDPIDGTRSFITGVPLFGTLIALLREGRPLLGVVDMPALAERWLGAQGRPTTWNGKACCASGREKLSEAILFATSPDIFAGDDARRFDAASRAARFRRFGGDCYGYGLLAAGLVDAVVECDLKPYDFMALIPVIEGAGGVVSDWQGRPLGLESDGRVLAAASAALQSELLGYLSDM